MKKELGQRSKAELEALFGDMYSGWDQGVVITQERFGDGETRFVERPMTQLELAARYVAAEVGANICEIANRAAFAPIIVFSQIQVDLGPVFAEVDSLRERIADLEAQINTPETADFMKGIPLEAAHQRGRWGADHDAGKAPLDWFWLIGYLAQKAAMSAIAGDVEKAKHHTISTAAALSNWHLQLSGADNRMRPGIAQPLSDCRRLEIER
jgi:hypothetical protein